MLAEGDRFGRSDARARRARDGRVRLGESDRPAARRPRPPGGARRRDRARCSNGRAPRVTREFYYNDAGQQIENLARLGARARAGDPRRARDVSGGRLSRRLHPRARAALSRRGRPRPVATSRRSAASRSPSCAASRIATCRRSACASTTTTSKARSTPTAASTRPSSALAASGKTYEHDGALWLQHHRIRRRQGSRDAQVRRRLHVLRARRRLPRHEVGARIRDA